VLVAATGHDMAGLEHDGVLVEGVLPSHRVIPRIHVAVVGGGQGRCSPKW
jgi:hypothetical protein